MTLEYILLLIVCLCLFMYGVVILMKHLLHIPTSKAIIGIMAYDKPMTNTKMSIIDLLCYNISLKFEKYISINPYKRNQMIRSLELKGSDVSPEIYQLMALTKSIFIIVFGSLISFLIMPALAMAFVIFGISSYFKQINYLLDIIRKNIEQIEIELPLFVSTLAQEFQASRNVLVILENYTKVAGKKLKLELEITIADMKTGDHERAIMRLDQRVGSDKLSDICYYLVSILRGNDNAADFSRLASDFKEMQNQQMDKIIDAMPKKLNINNNLIVVAFAILVFFTLISVMAKQMGEFF